MKGWICQHPLASSRPNRAVSLVLLILILFSHCGSAWSFPFQIPFFSDDDTNIDATSGVNYDGIDLIVTASPDILYSGEMSELKITVANRCEKSLRDVIISGDISAIQAEDISPDEAKSYTKNFPVQETCTITITASAKTDDGETFSDQDNVKISVVHPALQAKISTSPSKPVKGMPITWQYNLENTGDDTLRRVKVVCEDGETLGILQQLTPGEKQTLLRSGDASKRDGRATTVSGVDSSGREIIGEIVSSKPFGFSGGVDSDSHKTKEDTIAPLEDEINISKTTAVESITSGERIKISPEITSGPYIDKGIDTSPSRKSPPDPSNVLDLETLQKNKSPEITSTPHIDKRDDTSPSRKNPPDLTNVLDLETLQKNSRRNTLEASGPEPLLDFTSGTSKSPTELASTSPTYSKLEVSIQTNKSMIYGGEVISYRCTARNEGNDILSDVEIQCRERKTTAKSLEPGQEFTLIGSLMLHDSFELNAEAKGTNSRRIEWINRTTVQIKKISPELKLDVEISPEKVCSGGIFSLKATVKNAGNDPLTDIVVWDTFGEIGRIALVNPGEIKTLRRDSILTESVLNEVYAGGIDSLNHPVQTSVALPISALEPQLNITVEPSIAVIYPGETVEMSWRLANTGSLDITNVTISGKEFGEYRIPRIAADSTMPLTTTYAAKETTDISVTAHGSVSGGIIVLDTTSLQIRTISPDLKLNLRPSLIEACNGENIIISCLITNTGDDMLTNVVLSEEYEGKLERIDELAPGDFELFEQEFIIDSNRTFEFEVTARDSKGKSYSDSAIAETKLIRHAIRLDVRANPSAVNFGEHSEITFEVDNWGSVPLRNIFLIGKTLGPLETIDYIPPGDKQSITIDRVITSDIHDLISAEGFTMGKESARDQCELHIELLNDHVPRSSDDTNPDPQTESPSIGNATEPGALLAEENSTRTGNETDISTNQTVSDDNSKPEDELHTNDTSLEIQGESDSKTNVTGLVSYVKKMLGDIRLGKNADKKLHTSQKGTKSEMGFEKATKPDRTSLFINEAAGDNNPPNIFDVSVFPSEPIAGTPVVVSIHAGDDKSIESATLLWSFASATISSQELLNVKVSEITEMTLEEGSKQDGYWSCVVPGQPAGTYLILSVSASDGNAQCDDGPYLLRWKNVALEDVAGTDVGIQLTDEISSEKSSKEEILFIESSSVSGRGDVSFKSKFRESTIRFTEDISGFGSIEMESQRRLSQSNPMVNFSENRQLSFGDGRLKGFKNLESPTFHGGMGASIMERFDATLMEKSETGMIKSINMSNNTVDFNTHQAFEGMWGTQAVYSKFRKKIKAAQQLNGTFETKKRIKFED